MKTTKAIQEVNAVINSSLPLRSKLLAIDSIPTSKRPGGAEAERLKQDFKTHVADLRKRLPQVDMPKPRLSISYAKQWKMRSTQLTRLHQTVRGITRDSNISDSLRGDLQKRYDNFLRVALMHISYSGCVYGTYSEVTTTLKSFAKMIAPYINDIKAYIANEEAKKAEADAAYQIRKNEDMAFRAKHGVGLYSSVLSGVKKTFVSPLTATKTDTVILGEYTFEAYEDVDKDWNYYAKSYHFPKVTVTGRGVRVFKRGKRLNDVVLDAFRGPWMVETIAKVLNLTAPQVEKSLRKFQIGKWTDVRKSITRGGVEYYKLLLGKYVIGYVAYDRAHDIHFHADTMEQATVGLANKVALAEKQLHKDELIKAGAWTADALHEKFGFCFPGIREFANAAGLDFDGIYTIAELREAIKSIKDRSVLTKYHHELSRIKVIA